MYKKKELLTAVQELNAHHKAIRDFAKYKYVNDKGDAIVHLYVDKNNLYDSHSNPNEPELDDSVIEYLDKQIYYIPVEYPVTIVLHSESQSIDVPYVEKKIKEHYWKELADKRDDLRKNTLTWISLLVLGLVLFTLYFIFQYATKVNVVFNEVFSIAATFCIWEAVDFGLIIRSALKIEELNIAQKAIAKVVKE